VKIKDRIYGEIEIKNQLIIDLIESAPMQRLKKVSQDGAPHYIQPVRDVTRFEHSIGVWYLTKKYDRPLNEQVAALLHDIPHTAFSHVVDFVMKSKKHDYHDQFMKQIVEKSEIPEILGKHDMKVKDILGSEEFPLLENDLPDLSVDRWDYFMRDGRCMGYLPQSLIDQFLQDVKINDDVFYFTDKHLAATFTILFANFSRLIWLDPTSHGAFFLLANAISAALRKELIREEDLFLNDEELWDKLRNFSDHEINSYLDRLVPNKEFVYTEKMRAEFYGPNKPRVIDPYVQKGKKLLRITDMVPNIKYFNEEFKQKYRVIGVRQP
jgi:hypothetical protein